MNKIMLQLSKKASFCRFSNFDWRHSSLIIFANNKSRLLEMYRNSSKICEKIININLVMKTSKFHKQQDDFAVKWKHPLSQPTQTFHILGGNRILDLNDLFQESNYNCSVNLFDEQMKAICCWLDESDYFAENWNKLTSADITCWRMCT